MNSSSILVGLTLTSGVDKPVCRVVPRIPIMKFRIRVAKALSKARLLLVNVRVCGYDLIKNIVGSRSWKEFLVTAEFISVL